MRSMQDEQNFFQQAQPKGSFLGKAAICALATGGALFFALEVAASAMAHVIARSLWFPLLNASGEEEAGLAAEGQSVTASAPVSALEQTAFYSAEPVYEGAPRETETPRFVEISEEGMRVDPSQRIIEEEWNALPW